MRVEIYVYVHGTVRDIHCNGAQAMSQESPLSPLSQRATRSIAVLPNLARIEMVIRSPSAESL